jgi:excinuclease ABC subunit B
MRLAMREVERRRKKQLAYNEVHGITPQTIKKKIEDLLEIEEEEKSPIGVKNRNASDKTRSKSKYKK